MDIHAPLEYVAEMLQSRVQFLGFFAFKSRELHILVRIDVEQFTLRVH